MKKIKIFEGYLQNRGHLESEVNEFLNNESRYDAKIHTSLAGTDYLRLVIVVEYNEGT